MVVMDKFSTSNGGLAGGIQECIIMWFPTIMLPNDATSHKHSFYVSLERERERKREKEIS
jgi:hypothetical protein